MIAPRGLVRLLLSLVLVTQMALLSGGAAQAASRFSDVPAGTQFSTEITWLADRGITTGYSDGTFRPVQPVNRDAMAAFLYRLSGSPAFVMPARPRFRDVPVGTQFRLEIEWLAAQGITTGYPDGTFRPTQPVNRDAMAAYLYRLSGSPGFPAPTVSPFADLTPTTQFYREITWLASTRITTGYPDKTFRPTQPVNRDAMAAFMFRYAERFLPPGTCSGVWVAVAGQATRCATHHATGADALARAGFSVAEKTPGFLCQIGGTPATCAISPTAHWSYWHAAPRADGSWGPWQYSELGYTLYRPTPGHAEGWVFGDGRTPPPPLQVTARR